MQKKIYDITDFVTLAILEKLLNEQMISQEMYDKAKMMLLRG